MFYNSKQLCKNSKLFFLQEKKKKHSRNNMKLLLNSCFVQLYKIIISHEQTGYLLEPWRLQKKVFACMIIKKIYLSMQIQN